MIFFLLEKVIRCAQMSVDCLRALKLVTLGYMKKKHSLKQGPVNHGLETAFKSYSVSLNSHI